MEKLDEFAAEREAANVLLEKGVEVSIERKTSKKPRKFIIRQPYLGTLYNLSSLYLEAGFDETQFREDPVWNSRLLANKNAFLMCKIVAVAILNNKLKIKLFTGLLARYLFWRLKPDTLLNIVLVIATLNNTVDFMNSIRLIGAVRATAPKNLSPGEQGG